MPTVADTTKDSHALQLAAIQQFLGIPVQNLWDGLSLEGNEKRAPACFFRVYRGLSYLVLWGLFHKPLYK